MNKPAGLKFEIVSTRTVEPKDNRKYVAYKVMIKKVGDIEDDYPAVLERRYNEFLFIYNELRREYPIHFSCIPFPRKTIVGNFSSDTINFRSAGFEAMLSLIGSESQFRYSPLVVSFLQKKELQQVIKLIQEKQYEEARPLVENGFRLMNKIQTDRSPSVLRWLCLFVCVCWLSGDRRAEAMAGLALRRYQAVSDIDLLKYYVPLLHLAKKICHNPSPEAEAILNQLSKLKSSGMPIENSEDLLTLVLKDLTHPLVT